ncbi:MAG: M48 family metallopeptidase [Janthinobacterium lividum]
MSPDASPPCGPVPVVWRRSARARRASLRIDARAGAVVLTLPARAARSTGTALLSDHAAWIADRLAALPPPLAFENGATLPIGDTPHRIRHVPAGRGGAWLEGGELLVSGGAEFLSRRVATFLRAEARRRFAAMALEAGREAGLRPRRVVVKDTRTRWGSCTADGTVMLSWRLLLAPEAVQHYVVAHEVAHLRHMNHGERFWALVHALTPHRAAAEAWLRTRGAGLQRVG